MKLANPDESSPSFYISLACTAISRQKYKEALHILGKGLEDSIESGKQYDSQKLLQLFDGLVTMLRSRLEKDYGDDWEEKVRKTMAPERALRCSFCGKSQNEVKKLIAGPTVYICN